MTVWERIEFLLMKNPICIKTGPNPDGASLVTLLAVPMGAMLLAYGHDFTVRAGSMDAINGEKLARFFELAGERAFLWWVSMTLRALHPAGVGGLDGYAEAFTGLRTRRCSQHYVYVHVTLAALLLTGQLLDQPKIRFLVWISGVVKPLRRILRPTSSVVWFTARRCNRLCC